ncbi:MAG TPA: hypothetical protein VFM09_10270 [Marmoricola sp.]|nr:hypothetical protein [Marmoricola sp.]
MTPLQRIALGLVIVVGSATWPAHAAPAWRTWDLLPDPVGWVLVVWGLVALRRLHAEFGLPLGLAVLAGLVSVPLWFPQLRMHLDASGSWAASLPQVACCLFLARAVAATGAAQRPPDRYLVQRFGLLGWGFLVVALLPAVVLGARVESLSGATVAFSMLANVVLIWSLFAAHRRPVLGGPGAREVRPD